MGASSLGPLGFLRLIHAGDGGVWVGHTLCKWQLLCGESLQPCILDTCVELVEDGDCVAPGQVHLGVYSPLKSNSREGESSAGSDSETHS